jgi:Ca-activated chloride channel homolog
LNDIVFAYPEFFYLFILFPFIIAYYIFRNKKQYAYLKVPTLGAFANSKPSIRQLLRHSLFFIRLLILSLLILILARPQTSSTTRNVKTEGIDIVIALDMSGSMEAVDFKPNRLEAAKKTALDFIDKRKTDRIGLVVFSGESFTLCPLTIDHKVLSDLFKKIKSDMTGVTGTAIGDGLSVADARLKESKAKSKVIILLTDGMNNTGKIDPLTATEIAKTYGIKVYTIGVGSKGFAPYPVKTPYGTVYQNIKVEIDEDLLTKIADMTGGKYFRATKNTELSKIYEEIDKMEKTEIDQFFFKTKNEEFLPFAITAGILFLIELLLRMFVFRSLP